MQTCVTITAKPEPKNSTGGNMVEISKPTGQDIFKVQRIYVTMPAPILFMYNKSKSVESKLPLIKGLLEMFKPNEHKIFVLLEITGNQFRVIEKVKDQGW